MTLLISLQRLCVRRGHCRCVDGDVASEGDLGTAPHRRAKTTRSALFRPGGCSALSGVTMRQSSVLAAAVTCAAIVLNCRNDKPDERPQAANRDTRPGRTAATVVLSGCLYAAPGTDRYVLRHVRFEPRTDGDPHNSTTTSDAPGITEGAWVRVVGEGLNTYLGQRVVLKGSVIDDGRSTIGTAGTPRTPGIQTPSGDTSQAASSAERQKRDMGPIARESMADGTAAEVRAHEVTATGKDCPR